MDAAASVPLLEPHGNLHNNRTNKRTLKALFFFAAYWFTTDRLVERCAGASRGRAARAWPQRPL